MDKFCLKQMIAIYGQVLSETNDCDIENFTTKIVRNFFLHTPEMGINWEKLSEIYTKILKFQNHIFWLPLGFIMEIATAKA